MISGTIPKTTFGTLCKPASVVVLPYPFPTRRSKKKRPVLVLTAQDEFGDFLAHAETSKGHHQTAVALTQDDMKSGSLPKSSWLRTDKVFALNRSLFVKSVGKVNSDLFQKARQSLCGKIGCTDTADFR